ncbi:5' nucleotidase, NT5C type [Candidatus Electronema sp. PJ]|uniref:5' nucleotidase, NT5C type n=1 Tax=Candidatus Electronema sp. PJ TaxID=3401572 RepID=UPI003AA7F74E
MKPTIDPTRLGFDFDGVIADTAESFLRIACEDYGLCGFCPEDITHFEVENCLDIPAEIVAAIFRKILEDSLGTGLRPMPGALEVLAELAERAGTVTVITARPLLSPVLDWFAHHLLPPTLKAVRVVAMGDHDDKPRYIQAQGLHCFIDDRAETCVQLHAAGIQPLVFSQPWNQDCRHFPVVNSWQEIRGLLLGSQPSLAL